MMARVFPLLLLCAAFLSLCPAYSLATSCPASVIVPGAKLGTCLNYSAVLDSLPAGPFRLLNEVSYAPYLITSPCKDINATTAKRWPGCAPTGNCTCSAFAGGDDKGSPAYQSAGHTCYALGHRDAWSVSIEQHPNVVVTIDLGHGVVGPGSTCAPQRLLRYKLVCDPAAGPDAGPLSVLEHTPGYCGYTVRICCEYYCIVVKI